MAGCSMPAASRPTELVSNLKEEFFPTRVMDFLLLLSIMSKI
jgi:hypothetical protein